MEGSILQPENLDEEAVTRSVHENIIPEFSDHASPDSSRTIFDGNAVSGSFVE